MEKYKYLGVMFDESLSFDKHLEHITSKIEKGLRITKLLLWKGLDTW